MNGQQENEAHADFVILSVVCVLGHVYVLYIHPLAIADLVADTRLGKGCTVVVPRRASNQPPEAHRSVHPHSRVEDPQPWNQ